MADSIKIQRYGWRPGLPDHRNYKFALRNTIEANFPSKIDLRSGFPEAYDQGDLGSCTANAAAGLVAYLAAQEGIQSFSPSRLFIYYNERVLENTVRQDAGASLSDTVKALARYGAPKETLWPYNVKKFKSKPTVTAYKNGLQHLATTYQQIDNTNLPEWKTALTQKHPVLLGFTVYESFESEAVAKTGMLPMPLKSERILGGHAVLAVGYDDDLKSLIVRNSWGPDWGLNGYFMMPYDYVTNIDLCGDCWVVDRIKKY